MDKASLELRARAEQIIDFTPQELSGITPEEIQRLFYDLQIYQIELQMQNDELKRVQRELVDSRDRYHFLYNQVPVGIVTVNNMGFIEQANDTFIGMLAASGKNILNKHFSKFLVEQDQTAFNSRFNGFFKMPKDKSMNLQFVREYGAPFFAKIHGRLDSGDDLGVSEGRESSKLLITVTEISDFSPSQAN
ncbi:MAG: PAS domain-containing protein [Methylococcaceae bacterium]|nr:PAS domain-containing protein [Methylococcaceae bacterium]